MTVLLQNARESQPVSKSDEAAAYRSAAFRALEYLSLHDLPVIGIMVAATHEHYDCEVWFSFEVFQEHFKGEQAEWVRSEYHTRHQIVRGRVCFAADKHHQPSPAGPERGVVTL